MSRDISLTGKISKVYCFLGDKWTIFCRCKFLHTSSFYGLHLQVLPHWLICFEMHVEESQCSVVHQHESSTEVEPAAA